MSLKFMYTNSDGTVAIVHAVPKAHLERCLGKLTHEEYRAHVLERSIPSDATNVKEITADAIPSDRTYRDAWVDVTTEAKVDIDMKKVKTILLSKLRANRDEKLSRSDGLVARSLESGEDMVDLKAKRQELRNATEALKAVKVSDSDVNSTTKLKELEDSVPTLQDIV